MALSTRVHRLSKCVQRFEAEHPIREKLPPEFMAWLENLDVAGLRTLRDMQARGAQGEDISTEFKAFFAAHPPPGVDPMQA